MKTSAALFLLLLLPLLFSNCQGQAKKNETKKETFMLSAPVNAPEINTEHGWLNTDRSFTLKDFRGKIVLLDFWTFGCINCQHIIPDLKRLEKEYARELVVIGVHSAKFDSEKTQANIRKAILKFGIEHPVVNDADYKVWQSYAVRAWPTVVLISPDGKVVGQKSGEGVYAPAKEAIDKLIAQHGDKIDRKQLAFQLEKDKEKNASLLRFPSKMIADTEGNFWLADSGNNRILKINKDGKILETIGKGTEGLTNGDFATATFYEPHGLALKNGVLYIADTKNNSIRAADLNTRRVSTLVGDGQMGYYYSEEAWNQDIKPNSPWDLLIDGDFLYIANAGNHQILRMDLLNNRLRRFAGTGREALIDGPLRESAFNQPSGLTKIGDILYVADAEASSIRAIDLKTQTVETPLGKGLFDFGDKDGDTGTALLQHAVGITNRDGKLYIADTYNGKIKIFDLANDRVTTLASGLNEPNGLLFAGNNLWITDTNNHQLVRINPVTNEKKVVVVK